MCLQFLDEPTSGLDAQSAAAVMAATRNVTENNRTVMVTIHQPSIEIFVRFPPTRGCRTPLSTHQRVPHRLLCVCLTAAWGRVSVQPSYRMHTSSATRRRQRGCCGPTGSMYAFPFQVTTPRGVCTFEWMPLLTHVPPPPPGSAVGPEGAMCASTPTCTTPRAFIESSVQAPDPGWCHVRVPPQTQPQIERDKLPLALSAYHTSPLPREHVCSSDRPGIQQTLRGASITRSRCD